MPRNDPSPVGSHWFEAAADHLGTAYLRYSFTKGTIQEVDFLVDELHLEPGMAVLDVGCGPGRHGLELARRGLKVTGVDISRTFVDLAAEAARAENLPARFERMDARALEFNDHFDAVISLCQGAFGLQGVVGESMSSGGDEAVLDGIVRALRVGGVVALSAFSAYFQVRYLGEADDFDASSGVNHEHTELRDESGAVVAQDLWTTCFTPRELRLLAERAGLQVAAVHSVEPGRYRRHPPTIESPEFLVVASKR